MNLLELIDEVATEVKKEDLQEAWDRLLLKQYLGNNNMGRLVNWFCSDHNLDWDQFNRLERVPKYKYQVICQPSRYLAAYLPKIWELLMAGKTNEEILAYLKRFKVRTLDKPIDLKKAASEAKERQQDTLKDKRNVLEKKSSKGLRLRKSKANWHTVKGVRS
jgi:hypothetical protein